MKTVEEVVAEKAVLELRVSALAKVSCEARKQLTKAEKQVLAVMHKEAEVELTSYLGTELTIKEEVSV